MNCPTCLLPQSDHTEEMAANCAVFDVLSVSSSGQDSEAETAPASPNPPRESPEAGAPSPHGFAVDVPDERCSPNETVPPTACSALSRQASEREGSEPRRTRGGSSFGISTASVLLGWCNDIKRELEEFANDGPVGPMVPYRAEAGTRLKDVAALRRALLELIRRVDDLFLDVCKAQDTLDEVKS